MHLTCKHNSSYQTARMSLCIPCANTTQATGMFVCHCIQCTNTSKLLGCLYVTVHSMCKHKQATGLFVCHCAFSLQTQASYWAVCMSLCIQCANTSKLLGCSYVTVHSACKHKQATGLFVCHCAFSLQTQAGYWAVRMSLCIQLANTSKLLGCLYVTVHSPCKHKQATGLFVCHCAFSLQTQARYWAVRMSLCIQCANISKLQGCSYVTVHSACKHKQATGLFVCHCAFSLQTQAWASDSM